MGAGSFGVSVLADNASLLHSAVIRINVSAPDPASGARTCVASGGMEHAPPPPPGQAPPIAPGWPGSRLINVSRMMPNVSFPGGGISGDPTVKKAADCQAMCDKLPACQTWTAFTITGGRDKGQIRCTMKAAVALTGCPVAQPNSVSGVKVAGVQRCAKDPHGFLPPRLDWQAPPFVLNQTQSLQGLDVRVLVDRSIVEVFIGGGRAAAVMSYQPPNNVSDPAAMDLTSYTSLHLFAGQAATATNVTVHQMGCGWNQSHGSGGDDAPARGAAPAYEGDIEADFGEWLSPGAGAPKKSPHLK